MMSSEKIVSNGTGSVTGSTSLEEEKDERMSTSSGEGSNKSAAGSSVSSSSSSSSSSATKKEDKKKSKSVKKDRRDPERFRGDGVLFKGKLIGVRDVAHPRGEKMARDVLQELKAQKKTSGEHKQKITVNIALDGLVIKDDKTKNLLYQHPVHKISFISQDASDSRAFGYIYGSPENEHTFFAIKTEKAAQQIVMCMRDLFQIAYELKKDEIVTYRRQQLLANQNTAETALSVVIDDSQSAVDSKSKGDAVDAITTIKIEGTATISEISSSVPDVLLDLSSSEEPKQKIADMLGPIVENVPKGGDAFFSDPWGYLRAMSMEDQQFNLSMNGFAADNVDPFNLNAHQQSTPIDGSSHPHHATFSPSNDPFNTSFVNVTSVVPPFVRPLPFTMPPSVPFDMVTDVEEEAAGTFTLPRISSTSSEDKYAALAEMSEGESDVPSSSSSLTAATTLDVPVVARTISESSSDSNFSTSSGDSSGQFNNNVLGARPLLSSPPMSVFSDLDPLGKDRPYVDKKDFFYDLKNPPKKVLKDLMAENGFGTTLEFMQMMAPSPSPSSGDEDGSSPAPPLTLMTSIPPPLPPPFHNHHRRRTSTISPTSSLEDAPMASCSSSSSSSSSATSPIGGEIFLPPPPTPPRPAVTTMCPPPPPLPQRQASQVSSPPIPIPTRRPQPSSSNSSNNDSHLLSSSSWDSNHTGDRWASHSLKTLPTANSGQQLPLRPNGASSINNSNIINNSNSINKNNNSNNREMSRNARNSVGNPFMSNAFTTSLTPASLGSTDKRPNVVVQSTKQLQPPTLANIFQKEADPFADDDFFATLHSTKSTVDNQNRSRNYQWTSDDQ